MSFFHPRVTTAFMNNPFDELPVLPITVGTYEMLERVPESGEWNSTWERQVDLRLIPTGSLLAGLFLLARGNPIAAIAVSGIPLIAASIWPLSGGPSIRLSTKQVPAPAGSER